MASGPNPAFWKPPRSRSPFKPILLGPTPLFEILAKNPGDRPESHLSTRGAVFLALECWKTEEFPLEWWPASSSSCLPLPIFKSRQT